MFLRSLKLTNFRSCAETTLRFDETLTVLAGENNAGKTNVLDALRLTTSPSEPRRSRTFERDDIRCGATGLRLALEYHGLDAGQRGLFFSALRANDSDEAMYQVTWSPPVGVDRRRWPIWTIGQADSPEVEPDVRDLVRHVHLPALRDADRDLASSSPGRIEFLLRQILMNDEAARADLLDRAHQASTTLLQAPPLRQARSRVQDVLEPLSAGFRRHDAHLGFSAPSLASLARDLRFSLVQHGMDPAQLSQTGLGYSNLLYLASVLVELEAARDAELTLLLVEEPEAHLHPQLQRATLAFLEEEARKSATRSLRPGQHAGRIQVVVSTHSPNLTAATSVEKIVVLHLRDGGNSAHKHISTTAPEGTVASQADIALPTATAAVAVKELALTPSHLRKIDRYLDATKSTLLFGRRVLLVEGIAESILLPAFARLVLSVEELARLRAACIVAIDGVDFEPYVRLLLAKPHAVDAPIAERVVVITDEDPRAPNQRAERSTDTGRRVAHCAAPGIARAHALKEVARSLGEERRLHVEVTPVTLEASLLGDEATASTASEFLRRAFASCAVNGERDEAWGDKIESLPIADRGRAFVRWMETSRTRKGDFAQALAEELECARQEKPPRSFPVPGHIAAALRSLVRVES